jgi:branched-chain amino acid transport system permease protein
MTAILNKSAAVPVETKSFVKRVPHELWVVLGLAVMPVVIGALGGSIDTSIRILLWGIFGLGFDILFGYAGLLSFGQAAFFGAGGFVTAYLLVSGLVTSVGLAIAAGVLASTIFSVLIGWVALRRVGIYFSMITFAIGELCFFVQHSVLSKWTGGDNGLPGVPAPKFSFGDMVYELHPGWDMYFVILGVFMLVYWLARRLVMSPFGRVLNASRINPERTLAVGHNVNRYKMAAFVVAAFYAAVAGSLIGIFQSYVGPDSLALDTSGQVVMQTVVGGVRTLLGPLVGAAVWIYMRDILQQIPGIGGAWKLILGVLFILAVTTMRRGIVGELKHYLQKRARALGRSAMQLSTSGLSTGHHAVKPAPVAVHRARRVGGPTVIEARHIRKQFGGLTALEDVCLSVTEGEIMGLIGPNGAGKSTLFKILTGEMKPTSGEVVFRGKNITGIGVRQSCAIGISKSYQIVQIYPELSMRENLFVPLLAKSRGAFRFDAVRSLQAHPQIEKDADKLLAMMSLSASNTGPAAELSYGEKRRLEIAIALATDPEVLLLDEPLAGLSAEERVQVVNVLKQASEGRTMLVVEHDMDSLFGLADRVAVLHTGKNLAVGVPEEIRDNPIVHQAYLGVDSHG